MTDQWNRTEGSEIIAKCQWQLMINDIIHDIGDISSKWGKDRLNS